MLLKYPFWKSYAIRKQVIEALLWRYATQRFDKLKKINPDDLHTILESGRLAPSSLGLQPWKLIVVENQEIRNNIYKSGYNQIQITDASYLIVIAYQKNIDKNYIDNFIKSIVDSNWATMNDLQGFKKRIVESISRKSVKDMHSWSIHQCYIMLGMMMQTAALLNIDTCPLEGFLNDRVDKLLNLNETDYSSVTILAVGYRNKNDRFAKLKKNRFPFNEIVRWI